MDLTIYDIIKGPIISEKASEALAANRIAVHVHPHANKPMIKEAVEKLFNVKVQSVNTSIRKGKIKRTRRIEVVGKLDKRAIVTLKPGYSLQLAENVPSGVDTTSANQ